MANLKQRPPRRMSPADHAAACQRNSDAIQGTTTGRASSYVPPFHKATTAAPRRVEVTNFLVQANYAELEMRVLASMAPPVFTSWAEVIAATKDGTYSKHAVVLDDMALAPDGSKPTTQTWSVDVFEDRAYATFFRKEDAIDYATFLNYKALQTATKR